MHNLEFSDFFWQNLLIFHNLSKNFALKPKSLSSGWTYQLISIEKWTKSKKWIFIAWCVPHNKNWQFWKTTSKIKMNQTKKETITEKWGGTNRNAARNPQDCYRAERSTILQIETLKLSHLLDGDCSSQLVLLVSQP